MLRCARICSTCVLAAAYGADRSSPKWTLEASADNAGSILGQEQHILDPGVAVSLLSTKQILQPAPGGAVSSIDFLRKAAGDSNPSPQTRGESALKPLKRDTPGWLAKIKDFPQGMHKVLSMTPGHMLASAAEAVGKVSPVKLPKEGEILDMFIVKEWTTTTYTKLGIFLSAILLFVAQSFAAGDFAFSSSTCKDESGLPQEPTWPSAEPASVFTLETRGLLIAGAAAGSHAEIRGPADCPSLRAVMSADSSGHRMKVVLPGSGEPLMILGPVRSWHSPQVMSVQRASTGVIGYLEPRGPGRWALCRDGSTELILKCDPWQRSVEVHALVQMQVQPREAPRLDEFEIEEEDEGEDGDGAPAGASSSGEMSRPGNQRLVARAMLRNCDSGGGALCLDIAEIVIAAREEVVLPLSCIVAALLMSPEMLDVPAGPGVCRR